MPSTASTASPTIRPKTAPGLACLGAKFEANAKTRIQKNDITGDPGVGYFVTLGVLLVVCSAEWRRVVF